MLAPIRLWIGEGVEVDNSLEEQNTYQIAHHMSTTQRNLGQATRRGCASCAFLQRSLRHRRAALCSFVEVAQL
eukprot:3171756-Rhodomonas_salina.1